MNQPVLSLVGWRPSLVGAIASGLNLKQHWGSFGSRALAGNRNMLWLRAKEESANNAPNTTPTQATHNHPS